MKRTNSALLLFVMGALAMGCGSADGGSSGDPSGDPSDSGATGPDGSGFDPDTSIDDHKVVKLTIDPADKSIEVVNGDVSAASIAYTATATLDDGTTVAEPGCTWQIDRIDLASFVGSTLKVSGNAGGTGKVTCTAKGLTASTSVTVALRDDLDASSGLDDVAKKALLATSTSDPEVKLLYPYDKTVFPRGLDAPELQWTGKTASDVYAARIKTTGMTFTAFFKAPPPSRAAIPKAEWTKLLDTATPTTPVEMSLYRLAGGAGGTPFKIATQSWTIASANLKGSIYYWRINGGKIVRIKPGAPAPEDFLKTEPGGRCVACHSVSHDGSTLVGSYENSGPYPWATFDVKSGAQKVSPTGSNSGFQAITPDGSAVLNGITAGTPQLTSATGTSFEPSGAAAFGAALDHPAFSPDNKWLAFANRLDGNWADFFKSDLMIAPYDSTAKKFGASKVLMASGGRVKTYPTFSPDSKWLAYMDSTQSTRPGKGDIHMMKLDGTGDVTLTNACAAGIADVDKSLNFEPTFGPVLAGGYFWMVFVSSRQYGNRINKTFDAFRDKCGDWATTPCRTKQLWVTAIDADPKPGVDPSHPAFWLPGQDTNDQNMRGYWALDPCKGLGEGCEAGFECCDGACKSEDGKSAKVCVKPPPGTCKSVGDKCEVTTDCCDASLGVECIGGVCGKKLPS